MISIVGNIKVDESKPERIKYLIACIRSYLFLKDKCNLILNLNGASIKLCRIVSDELIAFPDAYFTNIISGNYGQTYLHLLKNHTKYDYVINFMEDQFMVCDDRMEFFEILNRMNNFEVDVCKSSFHKVELNSIAGRTGAIFENNFSNFVLYKKYYGSRYFIGCNFITTKQFALDFWGRDIKSKRPHEYEIAKFDPEWVHRVMVPSVHELQAAIDDDHGEPNTCLLNRTDCEKWNKIWAEVNQ